MFGAGVYLIDSYTIYAFVRLLMFNLCSYVLVANFFHTNAYYVVARLYDVQCTRKIFEKFLL